MALINLFLLSQVATTIQFRQAPKIKRQTDSLFLINNCNEILMNLVSLLPCFTVPVSKLRYAIRHIIFSGISIGLIIHGGYIIIFELAFVPRLHSR